MENIEALTKLQMKEVVGGYTATQTEHSHLTGGWYFALTGTTDVENCGDSYADDCCE